MGTATINGELWGVHAQAWSQIQEGQVVPLYEAVFDAAGVGQGTAVLDVGCGSGLALQLAARRGVRATGLDASAALIAVAKDRTPDADLRVGELEKLPYPDDTFDVATTFNAVQYASDPGRALAELARVVRPGGLVAVATWGQPEACEITAVMVGLGPLMPPPPPYAPHAGPFALSAPGLLESFISSAGLTPVQTREVACPMTYPDLDTAITGQASPGVMVGIERHAGADALHDTLRRALTPFVRPDRTVRLHNTFRFVVGAVA